MGIKRNKNTLIPTKNLLKKENNTHFMNKHKKSTFSTKKI